jgi:hypothetical protein
LGCVGGGGIRVREVSLQELVRVDADKRSVVLPELYRGFRRSPPDKHDSRLSGVARCPLRGCWIFGIVGRENEIPFPANPNSAYQPLSAGGSTRFNQIAGPHLYRRPEAGEADGVSPFCLSPRPTGNVDPRSSASATVSSATGFASAWGNQSGSFAMKTNSWRRWLIVLLLAMMLLGLVCARGSTGHGVFVGPRSVSARMFLHLAMPPYP